MAEARKKLAIIDGKSVFYRGYYAMPNLSTGDGVPTGGVFGFAAMALELIKKLQPDYVCVAWDKPKTNIRKRKEMYPEYKAGRKPAPPDFYTQIPILHDLLSAFGWPLYELDDYEADDIMGTLAVQAEKKDVETLLITSDLDVLQLITHHVKVYALKKGFSNIEEYHPESFEAKYGLQATQFLDLKALKGDSSDNIPGVPGIGEKTAIELLKQYKTLDGVYENIDLIKDSVRKKLVAGKDSAYLSKKIAAIWCDAPMKLNLKEMDSSKIDVTHLHKLLEQLEFRSLLRNLPANMQVPDAPANQIASKIKLPKYKIIARDTGLAGLKLAGEQIFIYSRATGAHGADPRMIILGNPTEALGFDLAGLDGAKAAKAVGQILKGKSLIGYDVKNGLKVLKNLGVDYPPVEHDILVGAFLINPLVRAQSLTELASAGLDYDGPSLDDLPTEDLLARGDEIMAVTSELYSGQKLALEQMPKVNKLAKEIEWPLTHVLADMEMAGIKLDTSYLKKFAAKLEGDISDIEQKIYGYADFEFNISSPIQLAEVLFIKLQLPTRGSSRFVQASGGQGEAEQRTKAHKDGALKEQTQASTQSAVASTNSVTGSAGEQVGMVQGAWSIKKGKTGYSTAASELAKLQGAHPIIDLISQYREATKLKNTYADTLPGQVDKNSRVHTTFNLTVAPTGRLSSEGPNLQNIPVKTELGRNIRTAFVAEKGNLLISADYSQFELRIAASLSGDGNMIKAFNNDADIHAETAAELYGIPADKVTKTQRSSVKEVNFGIMYGLGPHALSQSTGMDFGAARDFIKRYFQIRPALKAYIEKTRALAEKQGYVETLLGRRRPTPDIHSSNFIVREAAYRAAINHPMQGTAADIMKLAMVQLAAKLDDDCKILLQIHDSLILETPANQAERVGKLVKDVMESAYKLPVKLKADILIGKNWGEL